MIEMTVSSRHRIRNSSPGGLRPSTLPLGHNTDFDTWMGKKHFCFFQTAETGNRTSNSGVKGSGANHHPRALALYIETRGRSKSGICPTLSPYFKGNLWSKGYNRQYVRTEYTNEK